MTKASFVVSLKPPEFDMIDTLRSLLITKKININFNKIKININFFCN